MILLTIKNYQDTDKRCHYTMSSLILMMPGLPLMLLLVSHFSVTPNIIIVGEVIVSKWATVWYNVTIRAEINPVRVGHFTSIGDGTSINANCALPHGIAPSVNIGKNVTIEPNCSIYSSIIDDDVVIGSKSVIMPGARLERGCQILPNSIVPPGRLIPAG
jgi:carbonic anhydrase/acetyltransferase-like protein (isoleucine patch superfamily)